MRKAGPEVLEKREQLAKTADSRHRVQAITRGYMNQTGLSTPELAHRINYGYTTLQKFLTDRYETVAGDDSPICTALLEYMDRYPIQPAGGFVGNMYEIGNVQCMRSVLARALEKPRIYMVYAPPGSGKTDVTRWLIAEHNRTTAAEQKRRYIFRVYCRRDIRPGSLMRRIARACGTPPGGEIDRVLESLLWQFRGKRIAIVFDEAQHLDVACLDTVRELLDQGDFSLIFTGAEDLEDIFQRFAGKLERLKRRITDRVTLPPVTKEEATNIVRSELRGLVPRVEASLIAQQIDLATVEITANNRKHRYISIGRLMAALSEAREELAAGGVEQQQEEVPA